jgi:hypothetical protein
MSVAYFMEEAVAVVPKLKELSTTTRVALSRTTCFPVPSSSNLTTKVHKALLEVFVNMISHEQADAD